MRIALLNPPARLTYNPEMPATYPLGLLSIAAVLEKAKHNVKIFDFVKQPSWKIIENQIHTYAPDIVGIKCDTIARINALRLAKLAKKINPKTVTILGGPHASAQYEHLLRSRFVDIVAIGEAEETIKELVDAISTKRSLKSVKGIAFKNGGGKTKDRPLIKDLDSIPIPAYHLLDFNIYKDNRNRYDFHIMTSRGCPFSCQFCDVPIVWGKMFRQHSVERIIKEIKELKKYTSDFKLYFHDDFMDIRSNRNKQLFNRMIEENLLIKWTMRTRVDSVDFPSLMLAKKAGLERISYGIESGSPKILNNINKQITKEQIINAFRWTKKAGIETTCTLIIGNPGESKATLKETRQLLKRIRPNAVYNAPACIFPGTPLEELAVKQGLFSRDFWIYDNPFPAYTGAMKRKDLLRTCKSFGQPNRLLAWINRKLSSALEI